jgi:hypothetical protein
MFEIQRRMTHLLLFFTDIQGSHIVNNIPLLCDRSAWHDIFKDNYVT